MNKVPILRFIFAFVLFAIATFARGQDKPANAVAGQTAAVVSASVCRNSGSTVAGAPSAYYQSIDEANSAGWYLEEDGSGNCFKEARCQSNSMLQPDHKTCACPLDMPYWDGLACSVTQPAPPKRVTAAPKVPNCRVAVEFGPLIARCDPADSERIFVLSNATITLADGSSGRYGEGAKWQSVRRGDSTNLIFPPDYPMRGAFVNITKIDACNWHADGFAGSYVRHTEYDGNVNFCQ